MCITSFHFATMHYYVTRVIIYQLIIRNKLHWEMQTPLCRSIIFSRGNEESVMHPCQSTF